MLTSSSMGGGLIHAAAGGVFWVGWPCTKRSG
jgi:hypothetical protein